MSINGMEVTDVIIIRTFLTRVIKKLDVPFKIAYIELNKYNPKVTDAELFYKHSGKDFNSFTASIKFHLIRTGEGYKDYQTEVFIAGEAPHGGTHAFGNGFPSVVTFVRWVEGNPNYRKWVSDWMIKG